MIAQSSINHVESELHNSLQRLSPKANPWKLSIRDIKDVGHILKGLKDAANPATAFLFKEISPENKLTLATFDTPSANLTGIRNILANSFNKRIDDSTTLLAQDFSKVTLRESTRELMALKPTGKAAKRLGRLLIEDCFPNGLKQLPADWDSPSDWLGKQRGIPSVKKIRQLAPNVAAWLLIEAVCGHSEKSDNLLGGILPIVGNLDEKVAGNMTRRQWFEELAILLRNGSIPEEYGLKFMECLEQHWGPLIIETKTGNGTQRVVNPLTYSAYCAARLGLWFDPREDAFYQYQAEQGIWIFLMEAEVQRLLLEWILEGMVPEAKRTLKFVEQIVKHLKVIALYEKTELPELFVHLADEMLYLTEERQPAPFSPAYFSKNRIPISYDYTKTARNTMFEDFLKRSLEQDDIDLLQKWCGYVLLGRNPHHKILLVRGVGGSGKSTLVDIFETFIGAENVASLNVERLDDRFELAAFRDKTLLIGKDVASNIFKSKAAHTLKALSGDQGIEAELKFENRRFKLPGPFNIVVTSNADLEIGLRGDAAAWNRRLLIIDFNKAVSADEKRLNYAAEIIKSSPEGILEWMLKGAEKVLKMERLNDRLFLSVKQEERIDRLLNQSSSSDFFIEKCIEAYPKSEVASSDMYDSYKDFCNQQVINPMPDDLFYKRVLKPLVQLYQAVPSENIINKVGERGRGYKQIRVRFVTAWPPRYNFQEPEPILTAISEKDILNAEGLRAKFADKQNPASQWVWKYFAKADQEIILANKPDAKDQTNGAENQKKSASILSSLVAGLNKFIGEAMHYSKKELAAIAAVPQRPDTIALLKIKPKGTSDVNRLKRFLLEDIFPSELARVPSSAKNRLKQDSDDVPFG